MAYWKNKTKNMKVLVRQKKAPMARVKKHRNLTDKEAKRENKPPRMKNYVNTTDGAKRASHHRMPSIEKMFK